MSTRAFLLYAAGIYLVVGLAFMYVFTWGILASEGTVEGNIVSVARAIPDSFNAFFLNLAIGWYFYVLVFVVLGAINATGIRMLLQGIGMVFR